jgi:hypothetical protein
LDAALAAIHAGTKKSSNIEVSAAQTTVDGDLSTFTIVDWTSTSRNITTPYTLVFTLRADEGDPSIRGQGRLASNSADDPAWGRFAEVRRRPLRQNRSPRLVLPEASSGLLSAYRCSPKNSDGQMRPKKCQS